MALEFEWDPSKAAGNLSKHGVSFGEAEGVFADPLALEMPDPDHSEAERRWITIGQSYRRLARGSFHGARGCDPNYQRSFGNPI